jgi:hypothetical protein
MEEDQVIVQSTSAEFTDLLWTADGEILFLAQCPPLGQLRVTYCSSLVKRGIDWGEEDAEGMHPWGLVLELDKERLRHAVDHWFELAAAWRVLWPVLLEEIDQLRSAYGRERPSLTPPPRLEIGAPGVLPVDDHDVAWSVGLEDAEFDGVYCVSFLLGGTITDSGASF